MWVTEADLRPRPVTVPQLADDLRQVMFTVIAIVPADLAINLLHGAAVDVITPANAFQMRLTVVRNLLS